MFLELQMSALRHKASLIGVAVEIPTYSQGPLSLPGHARARPNGSSMCPIRSPWTSPHSALRSQTHASNPLRSSLELKSRGRTAQSLHVARSAAETPSVPQGAQQAANATGEDEGSKYPELIQILVKVLKELWQQCVALPLGNFGFGKKSIWEGGVGLFMLTGVAVLVMIVGWVQGVRVRTATRRYQAVFEFAEACGIAVGTPVRIRGVDVGSVVGVRPSLEKIDAIVEILDDSVVIPRNALVEVNQSGLISETLIDVTPQPPMPSPTVGPLHPSCPEEGLIVCERERIRGSRGVSLDELVGICTKVAKEMDQQGVSTMFEALDKFAALAEEARPLLEKVNVMAEDVKPLLSDLKGGELMKNLEKLTGVALEAVYDIRALNNAVLTSENTELLRQSVSTLTSTLKHIEGISADVSALTGDPSTRNHLKQLIESLSRMVAE